MESGVVEDDDVLGGEQRTALLGQRLEYYSADGEKEYWSQLPPGQVVEISLLQGLVGVYQYDLKSLSGRYEQFYPSGR